MAWQMVDRVRFGSNAKPMSRYVLFILAGYANDDGEAWPSHQTIMDETGLGRTAVKSALADLVKIGELEVISVGHGNGRGQGRSTRYRVQPPLALNGSRDDPTKQILNGSSRGVKGSRDGVKGSSRGVKGSRDDPEQLQNTQGTPREPTTTSREGDGPDDRLPAVRPGADVAVRQPPDWVQPLLASLEANGLGDLAWDFRGNEELMLANNVQRLGVERMVKAALTAARTAGGVSHARFFFNLWTKIPNVAVNGNTPQAVHRTSTTDDRVNQAITLGRQMQAAADAQKAGN